MAYIISPEDRERVAQHNWYPNSNGYYRSTIHGKKVSLHRFIIGEQNIPEGYQVDHINRNVIDDRRENLRLITARANQRNTKRKPFTWAVSKGYTCASCRWRDENSERRTRCWAVNKYGRDEAQRLATEHYHEYIRPLYADYIDRH